LGGRTVAGGADAKVAGVKRSSGISVAAGFGSAARGGVNADKAGAGVGVVVVVVLKGTLPKSSGIASCQSWGIAPGELTSAAGMDGSSEGDGESFEMAAETAAKDAVVLPTGTGSGNGVAPALPSSCCSRSEKLGGASSVDAGEEDGWDGANGKRGADADDAVVDESMLIVGGGDAGELR
jgi:hypothetical protein